MTKKFSKIPTNNNTYISDLNELLTGFVLNKNKWFDPAAENQHDMRMGQVSEEQYMDAIGKAEVMADEFLKWAKKNKYSGQVKRVWWTARPGSMSSATGYTVDQKKNPTDILIKFSSGPADGFLGLSAKATKGKGDIGFKNPGLGTIDKVLRTNLAKIVDDNTQIIMKKIKLPTSTSQRKAAIRANKNIQKVTQEMGARTLTELSDAYYTRIKKMPANQLYEYIVGNWMDAEKLLPPYVKVTGQGNKAPYQAKVDDPLNNPKLEALRKGQIRLDKNGISSVLVVAGGKNIMKMRFKWESEPHASSMKMSGDPA